MLDLLMFIVVQGLNRQLDSVNGERQPLHFLTGDTTLSWLLWFATEAASYMKWQTAVASS